MLFASACDKVYINGDLDGFWKLQKIEHTDSVCFPKNIYYSFQRHMTQIGEYYDEQTALRFLGNLTYTDDTLTMSGFRKYLEEEHVCSPEELRRFFLYSDSSVFAIEKLDEEILIMQCDGLRYTLRKW